MEALYGDVDSMLASMCLRKVLLLSTILCDFLQLFFRWIDSWTDHMKITAHKMLTANNEVLHCHVAELAHSQAEASDLRT